MSNRQLEIQDIDVYYGELQALRKIRLLIEEGEIVTLIGANGAGKSTTINTISGILKPFKGQIIFEGSSVGGFAPKKIVKMGIAQVPEGRRIFPYLTVFENLRVGAYLQKNWGEMGSTLETIYHYFPILKARQNQRAGSLSGGEQQMLAIGRALMTRPRLLLMDEPSLGLSPILCRELVKMTQAINQTGVSILLVEQNARMALGVANRGYVMEKGTIFKEGKGKDLLNDAEVKKAYLGG
jgi:branched-chain amino acid transport system ATP-binding protein